MSELREFEFLPLKRAARYLVGKTHSCHYDFRRQEHVDKISVSCVHSDFAGDPVSRKKSTTGLVAQIGNTHCEFWMHTFQSLTALKVGEAEFYAVVKGGQVRLILDLFIHGSGNFRRKLKSQCDSSVANSLTDRLGARRTDRNTLIHDLFWVEERVQYMEVSVSRKFLSATNVCSCWNASQSLLSVQQTAMQICRNGLLLTMDPTLRFNSNAPKITP